MVKSIELADKLLNLRSDVEEMMKLKKLSPRHRNILSRLRRYLNKLIDESVLY